jgi:hypothetical protein
LNFSDELWEQILPILSNFYHCIKYNIPPEISAGDIDVINKLYPGHETEVDLSEDVDLKRLLKQYDDVRFGYDFSQNTVKKLKRS